MMTRVMLTGAAAATAVALLGAFPTVAAPAYPSNTVRLLCWSSAGAPLDVMMRQVGKQLGEIFNRTFVVENRPGGEGALAMAAVVNAPADGHTILSTTSSMSFAMATGDGKFGPDDFIVLPALQAEPSAVAVRADSRFKSLKEFVDFIRDNPDKLSVGGFSSAGFHQYVFYRLQQEGRFKSIWIPYKGGQDAALALLGGHIDVAIITPSSALSQLQSGDIRLLGVSAARRSEYFLQVPTFKEQGYDVVESIWRSMMLKAGTPRPVVHTLVAALDEMKQTERWKAFSRQNMQSDVPISLDGMQKQVRDEIAADRAFLRATGIRK
jgi:putative tricarboxylic transport membrane protein